MESIIIGPEAGPIKYSMSMDQLVRLVARDLEVDVSKVSVNVNYKDISGPLDRHVNLVVDNFTIAVRK